MMMINSCHENVFSAVQGASPAQAGVYASFVRVKEEQHLVQRFTLWRGSPPSRGRRVDNIPINYSSLFMSSPHN